MNIARIGLAALGSFAMYFKLRGAIFGVSFLFAASLTLIAATS